MVKIGGKRCVGVQATDDIDELEVKRIEEDACACEEATQEPDI